MQKSRVTRVGALLVGLTLVAAACGDDDDDSSSTEAAEEATEETEAPVETDAAAGPEPAPVGGRAFATDVQPESQFDGNPFPDLVVDDVGRDGQANIANILPSERPVLLWAWAPH